MDFPGAFHFMSRGFVSFLAGIAMTILSWYGPWEWPAWPAFATIHVVFGTGSWYHDLSYGARSVVIVLLITINVSFWAAITFVLSRLLFRGRGRRVSPCAR